MTINGVSSLCDPSATAAISQNGSGTTATTNIDAGPAVSVDVSRPGQLFGELSSLAQSDPAKFKSVTATIAQQLKSAASSASGPEATALSKLADRFSAASESGNASDLLPQRAQGAQGGHHHHHRHAEGQASGGLDGGGGGGSLMQTVQGIISSALQSAGGASAASVPSVMSPSTTTP